VILLAKALQQPGQICPAEAPLKWRCDVLVVLLKREQKVLNGVEVVEVVRAEHPALDHAVVDLDLVEPAGMNGRWMRRRFR
jgi:hypothetical protein